MMPKCRDVARFVGSDGLAQASWPSLLLARLHRLYCKDCRRYAADLATIGRVSRETLNASYVDPEILERLEGVILDLSSGPDEGREGLSDIEGPPRN